MPQGLMGFQYGTEVRGSGVTAVAGFGLYLEMMGAMNLGGAVREHVRVAGRRGWLDIEMVVSLLALNLVGGDRVEDMEWLSRDRGLTALLGVAEKVLLTRRERCSRRMRMRRGGERGMPSPSSVRGWLGKFDDPRQAERRERGKAFVPAPGAGLKGLGAVNASMVRFMQVHRSQAMATLDFDATVVASHKREALPCYLGYRAYQPLNCWWAEQGMMVHSQFRDGNVPAGYGHLSMFEESLAMLPEGVKQVRMRTDTAGYQKELLLYCGEGKSRRFGVIEFAVGADVSEALREEVHSLAPGQWQPLMGDSDGKATGQEWAEVPFVPNWAGYSKRRAQYRFLAIRERLNRPDASNGEQLPFPTHVFGDGARYKLFAVVTNLTWPGEQVLHWHRERCGKSEEAHSVLKRDLAGGALPSGRFGANAAWWALAVLAHNLNALLKRLVLGPDWVAKRMKAIRLAVLALPGRLIGHGRRVHLRLPVAHPALGLLVRARRTIRVLAQGQSP